MITYRTEILSLVKEPQVDDQSDVVTRVYWRVIGRDKATGRKQEGRGSSVIHFARKSGFTPFGELTDRTVKRWIAKTPEVASRKADIAQALATADVAPPENVAPPWRGAAAN